MADSTKDMVGQTLGNCTLTKLLGQGGMGAVYLARQARPARNVAVKVLQPNLVPGNALYPEFLARFQREADVIARLEHVNIMPIYEYGEQDGMAYLVMPYLTGGSLRDVLAARGALSLTETMTYIDQAASALDYAHAHGVIHRDLKPANFLLHADGRLVLADFGIARIIEESTTTATTLTRTGAIVGTPDYMAPEMARGETIDYRVDIYELGIVLFQMLSGHVPFSGSTPYAVAIKHIQDPLPSLQRGNPAIPVMVDTVIQRATAKVPEDRYQSAKEMAQALRAASTMGNGVPAQAQVLIPPPPPPPDRSTVPSEPARYVLPAQQSVPEPVERRANWAQTDAVRGNIPAAPFYQPHRPQTPATRTRFSWQWIIGIITALIFVIVGIFAGSLLISHGSGQQPLPRPTATSVVDRVTPAPTATTTNSGAPLPVGAKLYATSSPGPDCDKGGGGWSIFMTSVNCQDQQSRVTNTAATSHLGGIFLTKLPTQDYPANYVIQAQFQLDKQSATDFGIYFRNQPGQQAEGTYTLLIHPDGTWNVYVYDNTTGAPTTLAGGQKVLDDPYAPVTLAVVVNGQQFSFYANGKRLGEVTDQTYQSGNAGVAVNQGGTMTVSKVVLSALAP